MSVRKALKKPVKKGGAKTPPARAPSTPQPTAAVQPANISVAPADITIIPATVPAPTGGPRTDSANNGTPTAPTNTAPQGPTNTAPQGPTNTAPQETGTSPDLVVADTGPGVNGQAPGTTVTVTGSGTVHTTPARHAAPGRSANLRATVNMRKPKGNQAILAPSVAGEIQRSVAAGEYRNDFGPHAPDPTALAAILEQAGSLSLEENHQQAQLEAVRNERNRVWDEALSGLVETFKTVFEVAVAQNSAIAEKFPATEVFMRTASSIGVRAAATRKAKKVTPATSPTTG